MGREGAGDQGSVGLVNGAGEFVGAGAVGFGRQPLLERGQDGLQRAARLEGGADHGAGEIDVHGVTLL